MKRSWCGSYPNGRWTERREVGIRWCCEPVPELGPDVPGHHRLLPSSTQSRRFVRGTSYSVAGFHTEEPTMEVVYERCCGLDIHKKMVMACVITPGADGKPTKEIRSFGTM